MPITLQVFRTVVAVLATAAGCRSTHHRASEHAPTQPQREQQAEYAVHSHLLRGQLHPIIVSDSSVPPFHGRAVFCFEPETKPRSCIEPQAGTSVDAWKDFARKNRQSWLLLPLFDTQLKVTLKRDATLPEATCQGPTITYFSRVGFNPALTEAVVNMTTVTGKGPMPPCGFATGSLMVLERTGSGWKSKGRQPTWIT